MPYSHDDSDVTVQMTSNSAPYPYSVSACSVYSSQFAYLAFDHNGGTYWASNDEGTGPWWIYYNFGSKLYAVNSYALTSSSATSEAPKTWTFQGSDNGEDWTVLNSQTDASAWATQETRRFSFSNATAYQYYRVYITAVQSGSYASFYEIEMFGSVVSGYCYLHARRDRLNMRPISTQNCLE